MNPSRKILFVLDDSKEQTMLQKGLEGLYVLDFCYDAHDALEHISDTAPDVVVLSFQDHDVSPLALAHILRQDPEADYVGLVYLAQTESNDWVPRLLSAGVDICLPQSRTLLQTEAAIEAVIKLREAKAEIQKVNRKLLTAYKKLRDQALMDTVTGFGNGRFLESQLRIEFKRASRYQKHLIVLLLRIDNFQLKGKANFSEENLLLKIAETIGSSVRFEIDYTGRSSDTEYFVILPETDLDGAISVAERMRSQIGRLYKNAEGKALTVSVGVAHYNGDRGNFENVDEFLTTARLALRAAEDHGGNQYWALDAPGDESLEERSA